MDINYTAAPTMRAFHQSDKFVRALIGPIGSGKSVACIMEMFIKIIAQRPNLEGVRKSRWVVVRNTYREIMDTTMRTYWDWLPEEMGVYQKGNMQHNIHIDLPDGTTVKSEVLFRALDKPSDVKKLLSLELTGGFLNECREIPKQVMDMLIGRLGRFPNMRDGGPSWHGLIMDTNPPDSDHWFYKLFEIDRPTDFQLFHQPSGISEEAENTANLPSDYYTRMMQGKDQEWINVYVKGLYGFIADGKPVFPEYMDDVHATSEPILIDPKLTSYIGIDFGLTPAAVFLQRTPSGRIIVFDELVTEDMGAKNFGKLLNQKINRDYPGYNFEIYGDPAGDQRAQTDEVTPFQILASEGIVAYPTYTNDTIIRIESIAGALSRMDFAGNTGFLIGPKGIMIRKALAGGYKYRRMAVSGQERFQDKPDKGRYSHVADALQYAMIGAGEGNRVIESKQAAKPLDYSTLDRMIA